jgi:hypothetical protein
MTTLTGPARRRAAIATIAATAAALASTVLAPPASAAEWDVVASGLDNPRHLSFRGSTLYVAEAGTGGNGPCIAGPEGEDVCLGLSGAITRVRWGKQTRVVTGLPSLAAEDGSSALGTTDVAVRRGHRYTATIGLGNDPAVKEELGWRGRRLGTVIKGAFPHRGPRIYSNIAHFEAHHDPDGLGPDSNPTGMVLRGQRVVLTDSGGNTLLRVIQGHPSPLAVFDSPGNAPADMGGFPIQPVPTSVAVGPDGAFYVSELTGFPFLPDIARIHRVVPGMPSTVYASGLTNVTDLAWHDGQLYAVQIADNGLLAGPVGSLVKVDTGGSHHTVAGGLFAPYGVAFHDGAAYVTTCSVCPDGGEVIRIPVHS